MSLRVRRTFYFGFIVLFVILIIIVVPRKEEKSVPGGFIAYGLYNNSGELIENGDLIDRESCSSDYFLYLSQDLKEAREYLVLVFIDYIQSPFILENTQVMQKEIYLNSNDEIRIPMKIDIPVDSNELSILIIKQPNFMVEENDYDHAIKTEDIISLRFPLASCEGVIKYSQNYKVSEEDPLTQVFISDDPENLVIQTVKTSNARLFLTLGNDNSDPIDYAVVAMHNWYQIPLNDNLTTYYKLPEHSRVFFDFEVPVVEEDGNYQIIIFPYPYNVDLENPESSFIYSTHRIHLQP